MTPAQMARKLTGLAATAKATERLGETLASEAAKTAIKAVYGDSSKLRELAESTQEERVSLGYTANDPLKRTGELLQDSIKTAFRPSGFAVGSTEVIAAYHEFGYPNKRTGTFVEPRPAIAIGARESLPEVEAIMADTAKAILGDRRSLEGRAFEIVAADEVA